MSLKYLKLTIFFTLQFCCLLVYCQEKIVFDSYTEYKYQEDETKVSKMISTVLYNSLSNDYYLVLSAINNKVKYVSLVDKKNSISYKLKPNDFINKVNENKLKIIMSGNSPAKKSNIFQNLVRKIYSILLKTPFGLQLRKVKDLIKYNKKFDFLFK